MSAYKATLKGGDLSDSDASLNSDIEGSTSTSISESEDAAGSEGAILAENEKKDSSKSGIAELPVSLRNRILMLTSRGVTFRHRHLLADLHSFLPHAHRDTKLDTKSNNNYNAALNGLADLHSCNYIFFFEARKHQDLYMYLAKAPNGPTIKFSVDNIHTMAELGFGGNCLKGGRGIVVFDRSFEQGTTGGEYKELIREMFRAVFCVPPKGIRGTKPFIDRVVGIFDLDGKIWLRIYEIREKDKTMTEDKQGLPESDVTLVEIGPRLVLNPIKIQEGSFGGPIIFDNKQFVSPNQVRREARLARAGKYANKRNAENERLIKRKNLGIEHGARVASALDDTAIFG